MALRAVALAGSPPRVLNITGPETLSIRVLATQFGQLLGRQPLFVGSEAPNALLNNAGLAHKLFGPPRVPLGQIVAWVAAWVRRDGPTLGRPTKFQARDGKF